MAEEEAAMKQIRLQSRMQFYAKNQVSWSGGDAAATADWVRFETGRLAHWKEVGEDLSLFFHGALEGMALKKWRREPPPTAETPAEYEKSIKAFLEKEKKLASSGPPANRAALKAFLPEKMKRGEPVSMFFERVTETVDSLDFLDTGSRNKMIIELLITSMPTACEQMLRMQDFSDDPHKLLVYLQQHPPIFPEVDCHQVGPTEAPVTTEKAAPPAGLEKQVEDLQQQLRALTTQLQDKQSEGAAASGKVRASSNGKYCTYCDKPYHNVEECRKRRRDKAQSKYCTFCRKPGHSDEDCTHIKMMRELQKAVKPSHCDSCKGEGHSAAECNRKNQATMKCFRCNQYGHMSYDCNLPPPPGQGRGSYRGGNSRQGGYRQNPRGYQGEYNNLNGWRTG